MPPSTLSKQLRYTRIWDYALLECKPNKGKRYYTGVGGNCQDKLPVLSEKGRPEDPGRSPLPLLFCLDIDAPVRAPVHLEAQGGPQVPQLVVGVAVAVVVHQEDGLQLRRLAVD